MLRFGLERAHKFKPQHLGGAHDEGVNGCRSALKRVNLFISLVYRLWFFVLNRLSLAA
jgi:hypothetical protein